MRLVMTSLMAGVLLVALHAAPCGAAGPMPGDYNGDGEVNHLDFVEWKANFGANIGAGTIAAPGTGADGNGDGTVDAADYTVWRDNASSGTVVNPIPEPATLALVALGGAALLGMARRRR